MRPTGAQAPSAEPHCDRRVTNALQDGILPTLAPRTGRFRPLTRYSWSAHHFSLRVSGGTGVNLTEMERVAMTTLIVDDEPIARRVLREGLELLPDVEVVGEADNGRSALAEIEKLRPELVFLDLQMPVMSGFEVVRNLGGKALPMIVVVTAFDQHAVRAFEAGAIDYLLKPVEDSRLQKAVERARGLRHRPLEIANHTARIAQAAVPAPIPSGRKIVGRSGADYVLLETDEVLAFQAERELVWIIVANQRFLATQPLCGIEQRLPAGHFCRVHRNAVVNVNHIRKMSALSSQRWLITLSNALQLVVSKRQAHTIRQILHW
jgi:DNA-binding LytR/AlgR family response regulator